MSLPTPPSDLQTSADPDGILAREALRRRLERDVLDGARALLGATLVTPNGSGVIVETEAYRGIDDAGCHAFGKSKMKNMALFGPAGHAYIYRSYGIHWMLNVAALPVGTAGGVLIRALRPLDSEGQRDRPRDLLRGPGRLTKALGIGPESTELDLLNPLSEIYISPAQSAPGEILAGPRIGLAEGKGDQLPWRYVLANELYWVSASRKHLFSFDPNASTPRHL